MSAGAEIPRVGGGSGLRGRAAGAAVVICSSLQLLQRSLFVLRRPRATIWASTTAAYSPQARVRARPSPGQRHPSASQTDLRAAPAEALQDRFHQGAYAANTDCSCDPYTASE